MWTVCSGDIYSEYEMGRKEYILMLVVRYCFSLFSFPPTWFLRVFFFSFSSQLIVMSFAKKHVSPVPRNECMYPMDRVQIFGNTIVSLPPESPPANFQMEDVQCDWKQNARVLFPQESYTGFPLKWLRREEHLSVCCIARRIIEEI